MVKQSSEFFSRLPTVTARIEDFLELSAPVPEKHCRLVKYDVPEVVCRVRVSVYLVVYWVGQRRFVRGFWLAGEGGGGVKDDGSEDQAV